MKSIIMTENLIFCFLFPESIGPGRSHQTGPSVATEGSSVLKMEGTLFRTHPRLLALFQALYQWGQQYGRIHI